MNKELRWRIITLQVVMIIVFAFGAGLAYFAGNFTRDQIKAQLEPQNIVFPADAKSGLPDDLAQYAGQQVLNGDQAHAYADKFIALHLSEMGNPPGKPYSYWSGQARILKDPKAAAAAATLADTMFKGETLRSMLNQAWAFWTVGTVALYAALGLAIAALIVAGMMVYELIFAKKEETQPARATAPVASIS